MSDFINIIQERGFIKDQTSHLGNKPIVAYIGFDLTAPSLHVGSLIQLMVLRWLSLTGNKAIALLGESTTKIGDPSGKDESRKMLSDTEIENNRIGIKSVIQNIVPDIEFVSNSEWFGTETPSFMDFLGEYGQHFTINRMMTFSSVKTRLDRQHPLTFLEFCYMLLQAIDFKKLHDNRGVNVQIGGSDQWGNIINGIDLIDRMTGDTVVGITTPLLLDKDGNKMGKSCGKPVWLDASLTSPFDFFQFWRNIDDSLVESFFKLFTHKSINDISTHMRGNINVAKSELAFDVTALVHGMDQANAARDQSVAIFSNKDSSFFAKFEAVGDTSFVQFLVDNNLFESKSSVRRLLLGNAVKIDGILVSDDFLISKDITVSLGKKKSICIVLKG